MIQNQNDLKDFHILCEQSLKLLDQLNIAAFTVDMDRKITTINHAAVTVMELEGGDIIGRDCLEVFCGVPCLISCLSNGSENDLNSETNSWILRENDPEPLITRLSTPVHDKAGNMVGCLTILQDNTPLADLISRVHHELVEKRLFREDLFYRLNVMRIELPPLKHRKADLPILIRHIMRRLSATKNQVPESISEEAMKVLLNYDYPGNVRELENILEHALIICRSHLIEIKHLPEYVYNKILRIPPECPATEFDIEQKSERKQLLTTIPMASR
jgi:transcriptional regulator with PAS, ATPase and Fis domain